MWEYLRWFFISRLQPSKPDTGVYKRDWWGRANYLCSHCFLWPGTIKSWWKPSPGQTDQLHTLQHSLHTCIHKWREGIKRVMHSAPKKKNSRGYEACSKKDGLVESSVTDCWPMSPSNVTSNTASKSNWRWPGARTGRRRRRNKVTYRDHYACLVFTIWGTVKPAMGDHPCCQAKVVLQDRWSPITEIYIYLCTLLNNCTSSVGQTLSVAPCSPRGGGSNILSKISFFFKCPWICTQLKWLKLISQLLFPVKGKKNPAVLTVSACYNIVFSAFLFACYLLSSWAREHHKKAHKHKVPGYSCKP